MIFTKCNQHSPEFVGSLVSAPICLCMYRVPVRLFKTHFRTYLTRIWAPSQFHNPVTNKEIAKSIIVNFATHRLQIAQGTPQMINNYQGTLKVVDVRMGYWLGFCNLRVSQFLAQFKASIQLWRKILESLIIGCKRFRRLESLDIGCKRSTPKAAKDNRMWCLRKLPDKWPPPYSLRMIYNLGIEVSIEVSLMWVPRAFTGFFIPRSSIQSWHPQFKKE